jgi:hypothetical protein
MDFFERSSQPLLPRSAFVVRLLLSTGAGAVLVGISLVGGMIGFRFFEGSKWDDAFLNASMLLSGMGPIGSPETHGGKLFAGAYALYSGFAVLVIAAITFGPVVHRLLHKLHLDEQDLVETETDDRPSGL